MGQIVPSGSNALGSGHSESAEGCTVLIPGLKARPSIPIDALRAELERLLSSQVFSAAERLSEFLRFVVEQSISGQADALKEWLLGVRVFGRSDSFDPGVDAIVRVEAGRLRKKLAAYYETEGQDDPVVIEVPRGSYAPVFHERSSMAPQISPDEANGFLPAANKTLSKGITSIIVLPFVNVSADPENEYFSDGLTEEVIVGLTRIHGLRVIARSTAFQYKRQAQDIRRISIELNVSAALEGSVRRNGDRLRITAQLIDGRNGFHLWAQTYERQMNDIFAIQQEIAEAIAGMVGAQLPAARPSGDTNDGAVKAYDLYLRAMYFEAKRTPDGFSKGLELLQLAVDLDPHCAPIFARMATSYTLRAVYGLEAPKIAMKRAGDAASRALEIDNALAHAHFARGFVSALYDWDWSGAGVYFRRALELNPGVPEFHHRYAVFYLAALGKTEEALWHIRKAKNLDPMSIILQAAECAVLVWDHQYEAAIAKGERAVELEPTYFLGHMYLSWAYLYQGKATESIRAAAEAARLSAESPAALAALGNAYALAERMDQAAVIVKRLQQRPYIPSVYVAAVYAAMKKTDETFSWLTRATRERSPALFSLLVGLWDQDIRRDPRFGALARSVGLDGAAHT
jgi:serine/threonine-protein kinase